MMDTWTHVIFDNIYKKIVGVVNRLPFSVVSTVRTVKIIGCSLTQMAFRCTKTISVLLFMLLQFTSKFSLFDNIYKKILLGL